MPENAGTSKPQDYYRHGRSDLVAFYARHASFVGVALDVGCAEGLVGAQLLERGFSRVIGVEPVPETCRRARDRLTFVLEGTLDSVDLTGLGPFDLVVLADCLEHMLDPWGAIERVRGLLGADGRLLMSVPNVGHWSVVWPLLRNAEWSYQEQGLLDSTHVRFFTPPSLREALEHRGFRILRTSEVTPPLPSALTPRGMALRFLIGRNPWLGVYQQYVLAGLASGSPSAEADACGIDDRGPEVTL